MNNDLLNSLLSALDDEGPQQETGSSEEPVQSPALNLRDYEAPLTSSFELFLQSEGLKELVEGGGELHQFLAVAYMLGATQALQFLIHGARQSNNFWSYSIDELMDEASYVALVANNQSFMDSDGKISIPSPEVTDVGDSE